MGGQDVLAGAWENGSNGLGGSMSGEMIAIVAVGVALAGVILTSLKGTETRRWKGCWKDCARPSPCGPPAANSSSAKTVASQPVVGYRIRSRTAKKEILA